MKHLYAAQCHLIHLAPSAKYVAAHLHLILGVEDIRRARYSGKRFSSSYSERMRHKAYAKNFSDNFYSIRMRDSF